VGQITTICPTLLGEHTARFLAHRFPERDNWLQVLGATERTQIDQRVRPHLHAIVPLLEAFKAEQKVTRILPTTAKRLYHIVKHWIFSQVTFSTTLWTSLRLLGIEPESHLPAATTVALVTEIPLMDLPLF
jgi:hypothetical protein